MSATVGWSSCCRLSHSESDLCVWLGDEHLLLGVEQVDTCAPSTNGESDDVALRLLLTWREGERRDGEAELTLVALETSTPSPNMDRWNSSEVTFLEGCLRRPIDGSDEPSNASTSHPMIG